MVPHTRSLTADAGSRRKILLVVKFSALVLFACFVGTQIYSPNARIVKLAIALALFWMTIKSPLPKVVAVLAFIIPFSAGTALGPTSGLAIILVFLVWMVRIALGDSKPNWRHPAAAGLLAFIMIHILSFYNTPGGYQMDFALKKFLVFACGVLLFYLVMNFVKDEHDLERFVWASMLSCAAVIALSLIELYFPRLRLIPWFTMSGARGRDTYFQTRRVGGPFLDGELLGEYMAISAPVQAFMLARARRMPMKAFWGLMIIGSLATALATMHRAPLISMSIGIVYLVVLFRKRMKPGTVMSVILLGALVVGTLEFVMVKYTPTGSVIQRIENTEFYGVVPDSRRGPWGEAWQRSLEHPWIGHGPYYDIGYPVAIYFTAHSTYLHYSYTIGFVGVAIFAWFIASMIRMTLRYMSVRTGIVSLSTDFLVVTHVQIVVFLIDAVKINYQRNSLYYLLVWLLLGTCAACYGIAGRHTAQVRELERARRAGMEVPAHEPERGSPRPA